MMRTGIFTLVLSLLLGFSVLAAPLDINTHTAAVPEQSLKLAATWFLPDWQAALSGRTDNAPDKSGDRHDLTCSTYGGCANIPANTTCSQTFSAKGTTCYKSCSCKSGYNQVNNADICQGCANPCDTVTAVATPYGCKTPWPVCPSKCQVAYPDNCHNRTAVPTPYGCQTPWSDCSTKCQTAYPDNCRNYSSKPLASSCANGCAQGKTLSDCTSRCAVSCKARCDTGYHLSSDQLSCVADSCPSGYEAGKTCGAGYTLEKFGQSGTQYCGKCVPVCDKNLALAGYTRVRSAGELTAALSDSTKTNLLLDWNGNYTVGRLNISGTHNMYDYPNLSAEVQAIYRQYCNATLPTWTGIYADEINYLNARSVTTVSLGDNNTAINISGNSDVTLYGTYGRLNVDNSTVNFDGFEHYLNGLTLSGKSVLNISAFVQIYNGWTTRGTQSEINLNTDSAYLYIPELNNPVNGLVNRLYINRGKVENPSGAFIAQNLFIHTYKGGLIGKNYHFCDNYSENVSQISITSACVNAGWIYKDCTHSAKPACLTCKMVSYSGCQN